MNDLISRDKAVAAVLATSMEYQLIYGKKEPKEGFVRSLIKSLASIPQEEPEWIPVSERLPEIKEHHVSDVCLVYLKDGGMTFSELQENIFGQVGWDVEREDDYHEPIGEVVAWMPLPEPYKEGKDASVE